MSIICKFYKGLHEPILTKAYGLDLDLLCWQLWLLLFNNLHLGLWFIFRLLFLILFLILTHFLNILSQTQLILVIILYINLDLHISINFNLFYKLFLVNKMRFPELWIMFICSSNKFCLAIILFIVPQVI